MLILCKFSIVGLLFLTHIAHAFVLLTANMEDVKKLARKFVSESLADKIAEFVAKATQNMVSNVSEENEMNEAEDPEGSHQVSEENNMYNVERHGFESAAQEAIKSREEMVLDKEKDEISISNSNEQKNKVDFEVPETDKTEKVEIPIQPEQSRYIKSEPKVMQKYTYPQQSEKPISKISEEDDKYYKEKEASKYLEDNLISTPSFPDKMINRHLKKKVKGRPYRLLSHLNSFEENQVTDIPDSNATLDDFSENELFNQKRSMNNVMSMSLTTKKAAVEFDQYDTTNYQKPPLVATSGPITLHMPNRSGKSNNWWEKEMPARNRDQDHDEFEDRRKSWF